MFFSRTAAGRQFNQCKNDSKEYTYLACDISRGANRTEIILQGPSSYMYLYLCVVGGGDERQGSCGVRQTSDSCGSPSGEHSVFLVPVESTETSIGFNATQGFIIQLVLPDFDLSHMTC